MAETNEIRHEIEAARDDMTEKIGLLQMKAKQMTDWHHQVGLHPWLGFGLSLGVGMMLAAATVPLRQRAMAALSRR